jgi:hypothetical protein
MQNKKTSAVCSSLQAWAIAAVEALPLDTFDMLSAAVNWVEKNTPPDSITATGRAFPGRNRPLCPYPTHA